MLKYYFSSKVKTHSPQIVILAGLDPDNLE